MSLNEINDHPKAYFILGDKAIRREHILSINVVDGKSLTDRSLNLLLEFTTGAHAQFPFLSAAQLNNVLKELDLEYTPTTETVSEAAPV